MTAIEKAFLNITTPLKTNTLSRESKSKFWLNCLTQIQHLPGSNRLFNRIANSPKDDISDYLTELWFVVLFKELGFDIIIEPFGDGPDMKIFKHDFEMFIEVTCFRSKYPGPPIMPLSETEEFLLVKYGDIRRDINKAYTKIEGKFSQLMRPEIKSSAIAVWNYDDELVVRLKSNLT